MLEHRKTGGTTSGSLGKPPSRSCPLTPGVRQETLPMRRHRSRFPSFPGISGHDLYGSLLTTLGIIRRMSRENPLWGAPRIHGELRMLGFEVSEAAVSKYMPRHPKPPSQTWRTFLENHVGCLASTDFFVVPTATFSPSIRARCAAARASADCSHRHHGTPDCGVGRATDPGGLSVGDSTTVYDPRSGSCVRYCLSFADKGDGASKRS